MAGLLGVRMLLPYHDNNLGFRVFPVDTLDQFRVSVNVSLGGYIVCFIVVIRAEIYHNQIWSGLHLLEVPGLGVILAVCQSLI